MSPSNEAADGSVSGKKGGWDEIESLFAEKKKKRECEKAEKEERGKRPAMKKNKTSRTDNARKGNSRDWVDDGLGGKYNSEGFTGRVEDGIKIFKAHVLYKPESGNTKDCPFDCSCCFI